MKIEFFNYKEVRSIKKAIKSTPFVGKIITNLYRKIMFIKPGGRYWQYDFKAMLFGILINKIVLMIGGNYDLVINNKGKTQIILRNGLKFWWISGDPGSLLGMPLRGDFEPGCTDIIKKLVKQGDTVFDIGGNFGWYSCHLAQLVGESGKVHVFEPTNVIEELKNNLTLNQFDQNVYLNQVALGEKEGDENFFIPKIGTAFASLRDQSWGRDCSKIKVQVKTLDDYVSENKIKTIDFIKIDVEGAEYLVFKGGENVLKNYSPVIMMELQDFTKSFGYSPEEVINYLKDLNYHIYEINDKIIGSVKEVTSFDNTRYYNFLVLKNDDILRRTGIITIR